MPDKYGRPKPPSAARSDEILEELGFPVADRQDWKLRWTRLRLSAPARGSVCYLSFRQYMKLAKKAGLKKPRQIGKTEGKYQMSRKGDTGDYEWGNCRFLTVEQNRQEKHDNGGTLEGVMATAEKLTGRTKKTHAGYASISEKRSKAFRITSPDQRVFKGSNLMEFCKKHNLHRGAMAAVCRGEYMQYKRWTGEYLVL